MLTMRNERKMPAYGRTLHGLRMSGHVPACYTSVIALDDWKLGKVFPRVVVSDDTDPAELDLSMLAGLDVTVAWHPTMTSIDRRDETIREVLKVNPASLRAIDLDNTDEPTLWIKSRKHGIERREYLC